jgi:hypothetical protein
MVPPLHPEYPLYCSHSSVFNGRGNNSVSDFFAVECSQITGPHMPAGHRQVLAQGSVRAPMSTGMIRLEARKKENAPSNSTERSRQWLYA